MLFAGVDAGSRTIKVVLYDAAANAVVASGAKDQGVQQERLATELLERLLSENGLTRADVTGGVATGYGRKLIHFADRAVTEITCHARGVHHLCPEVRTVVEVGGQDSKLIRLNERGAVADFAMNDRCAAGTGRFLEEAATHLEVELPEFGELARRSRQPAQISDMCVVFAQTEIVGLLAGGVAPMDIAAGIQAALAVRIAAMAGRRVDEPVALTGGVALTTGMREALSAALGCDVSVVPQPLYSGALGAALLAAETVGFRV